MFLTKKDLIWTKHSREKLLYYNLSEKRVLRVLRHPFRTEEGIAEGTLASCQRAGSKKHPYEIWVMYQIISHPPSPRLRRIKEKISDDKSFKVKIISTWKYPGISPKGKEIPIPEEILRELKLE